MSEILHCQDCPFYDAETSHCLKLGSVALPDTKACSLSKEASETPKDKLERAIADTEDIIRKARAKGHWKCVKDFTKKLTKQKEELRTICQMTK